MKLMRRTITILIIFLTLGCTTPLLFRAEYALEHSDELVATNSPTLRYNPKPELTKNGIEFTYSMLVRNTSSQNVYKLVLPKSLFVVQERSYPADCFEFETIEIEEKELKPRATIRIECDILIPNTDKELIANKDSIGEIRIPYSSPQKLTGTLPFKYRLLLEDLE